MNHEPISKELSLTLDYAKALGIVLVVMHHIPQVSFSIYHAYMYHMPLFFFIGGVLFNGKKSIFEIISGSINRNIPYLAKSYTALAIVGCTLSICFGIKTGYFTDGSLLGYLTAPFKHNFSNNRLFIIGWFILAYCITSSLFGVLIKLILLLFINKHTSMLLLALTALTSGGVGFYLTETIGFRSNQILIVLSQVLVGGMFYVIGFTLRNQISKMNNFYVFIILSSLLLISRSYGFSTSTDMSWGNYRDGFFFTLIDAMVGIYAVLFICNILRGATNEMKLLRLIGRSSRSIMTYHILCFVMFDLTLQFFGVYEISGKDAYLGRMKTPWSLVAYTCVGVFIPLLVCYAKQIIIKPEGSFRRAS